MTYDESRVLEYALDTLDPAERVEFERELERNAGLRAQLYEVRLVFDTLVEHTEPVPIRPDVRERLLKSVSEKSRFEGFLLRLSELFDLSVEKVRAILKATHEEKRVLWEQTRSPGVDLLHFAGGPSVAAADCGLVRIAPGTQFPYHTHDGDETALVLAGCLKDSQGQVLHAGDVSFMQAGSGHSFIAAGSEELVLAVVVNEGISFR